MVFKSSKSKAPPAKSKTTIKPKSNKDIVLAKHPNAKCVNSEKNQLFYIIEKVGDKMNPLHSGFASNESDAWKRAAHEVM